MITSKQLSEMNLDELKAYREQLKDDNAYLDKVILRKQDEALDLKMRIVFSEERKDRMLCEMAEKEGVDFTPLSLIVANAK